MTYECELAILLTGYMLGVATSPLGGTPGWLRFSCGASIVLLVTWWVNG